MALYRRVASKLNSSLRQRNSFIAVDRIRYLSRNYYDLANPFVIVSEEIREAIDGENTGSPPVVALESAIYTHGTYDVSS